MKRRDVLTVAQRSYCMSRIRAKDTKPELAVREIVRSLRFKFQENVRSLPGTPDLVFPSRRAIVLVHGCFWHMHRCKLGSVRPGSNAVFWHSKRMANVKRDRRVRRMLVAAGWRVRTIWQCQLRDANTVRDGLRQFLKKPATGKSRPLSLLRH